MRSPAVTTNPFEGRRPAQAATEGYLGSSLDLRAGLRVRVLLVSACPPDVVCELARMRRAWSTAPDSPLS